MKKEDFLEFGKVMAAFAVAFNEEPDRPRVEIYFRTLKDYSLAEIKRAAHKLMRTLTFFPKIAEFVCEIEGDEETRALRAWAYWERLVEQFGVGKSVNSGDRILHAVAQDMKLWADREELGWWSQEEDKWKRNEFVKLYRMYSRQPYETLPEYMPGYLEITNRRKLAENDHERLGWTAGQIAFVEGASVLSLSAPYAGPERIAITDGKL